MGSCFPVPSFQTCVCTCTLVLAAATPACVFSQAISFGTSLKIDYPNSATYTPVEVAPGDFNGDGNTDLVLMTQTIDSITPTAYQFYLLTGDGNGKFTSKALPISPHPGATLRVADVNGDGHQDILYAYSGAPTTSSSPGTPGTFEVWLGDGTGSFHRGSTTSLRLGDVGAELGDFNGDGKPDLAIMTSHAPDQDALHNETWLNIFLNAGGGSFRNAWTLHDAAAYEYLGPVGDYNGDGKQDLVFITQERSHFRVISGKGDGSFTDPKKTTYTLNTEWIGTMSAADLNRDGKSDIIVSLLPINPGVPPKIATLLAKQTTGFYWYHNVSPAGGFPLAQLADLNGDGRPDILYLDQNSGSVHVFPGEANALFGPEQLLDYVHVGSIATAPLKAGGLPDIFVLEALDHLNGPGILRVDLNISK